MKKYLSLIVMIFAIGCLCACGSVSSNEVSIYDTSTVITTLYVTLPLLNVSAQITASDCV